MNILGVIIFMVVFCGLTGLIVYMALFAKKKKKDDVSNQTTNTDGQCIDCDGKPVEPAIVPNTVEELTVKVELRPNNPPEVPAGVFCTRTKSIQAIETITGWNGNGLSVKREWYDNEVLRETNTTLLTGFFYTGSTIKYEVTVGDKMGVSAVKIV